MKANDCLYVFNKSSLVLDSKFLTTKNYALRAFGAVVHGVVFLPLHFMQLILMAPVKSILTWKIAPLKESDLRLCRTLVHIPALLLPSRVKKAQENQVKAYQKVMQDASWRKNSVGSSSLREGIFSSYSSSRENHLHGSEVRYLNQNQEYFLGQGNCSCDFFAPPSNPFSSYSSGGCDLLDNNSSGTFFREEEWVRSSSNRSEETVQSYSSNEFNDLLNQDLLNQASGLLLGMECSSATHDLVKKIIANPMLANMLIWSKKSDTGFYSVFLDQNKQRFLLSDKISTRIFCAKPSNGQDLLLAAEIPQNDKSIKRILGRGGFTSARVVRTINLTTYLSEVQYYVMKKKPDGNNISRKKTIEILRENSTSEKCFALPYAEGAFYRFAPTNRHNNILQEVDLEEVYLGDLCFISNHIKKSTKPFEVVFSTLSTLFKGLEQLHGLGLSHNDIKYENIFLSKENKALLGDWDVVNKTNICLNPVMKLFLSFYSMENVPIKLKQQNDVWALGLVIMELLFDVLNARVKEEYSVYNLIVNWKNELNNYFKKFKVCFNKKSDFINNEYLPRLVNDLKICLNEYEKAFNTSELKNNLEEEKYFRVLLGLCKAILLKNNDCRITARQIAEIAKLYAD